MVAVIDGEDILKPTLHCIALCLNHMCCEAMYANAGREARGRAGGKFAPLLASSKVNCLLKFLPV